MAVTYAQFVAAHLEFANTEEWPQTSVEQALADAVLETPSEVWGGLTDVGIRYLAGHLLAVSPRGIKSRMVSARADGSPPLGSTYLEHRMRLARQVVSTPIVA